MHRDPALLDEWLMRTEGEVGIIVSGSFRNSSAVLALITIPDPVIWSYLVGIFLRGDWQKARGFDKLLLAASLTGKWRERATRIQAAIARYFVAIPVLFFSFRAIRGRQLRSGNSAEPGDSQASVWRRHLDLPGSVIYAVAGILLLVGKKTRVAASWLGLTVLLLELVVYVPAGVVDRASLIGINFAGDTLMFCGAVLLLAGARPREA
jgi:uncharacterized membrane protein YphA (DoxX/SURF4 family)